MSTVNIAPYGSWISPITSDMLTEHAREFADLQLDPTDEKIVYWSEVRYAEGGRVVICSQRIGEETVEWTPPEFSAKTKVHEYGGGAFLVHGRTVYFSNKDDQRIYKQVSPESKPEPITPADNGRRYADGRYANNGIYFVCEDHAVMKWKHRKEPENFIVFIDVSSGKEIVIAHGADFYANPRVSFDGKKIAWMQWNHPNMPWDTTEIWHADLKADGTVVQGTAKKLCSKPNVSYMEPKWGRSGELFYASDESNCWNLNFMDTDGMEREVYPQDKELGGPMWKLGKNSFSIHPSLYDDIATSFDGKLGLLNVRSATYHEIDSGFSLHSYLLFAPDHQIYCVAASPTRFPTLIRYDTWTQKVFTIRISRETEVDEGFLSIPEHISFPTGEDGKSIAYGYFYAPKNKNYRGHQNEKPPLLVMCHGGPTGTTTGTLNLQKQYYTSKGFAILDVNYRGSAGYGRKFRDSLKTNWGVYDVEDSVAGVDFLISQGKVDPKRICIKGGSAGGYTVLAALAFTNKFHVGASHYGIGDQVAMQEDTHKFESRYLDSLFGPWPEAKELYEKRSPINFLDTFNCPVVFFQGLEDKIVLPNQAQMMHEALKKKGIPTALVEFEGEGHGFVKSENIKLATDGDYFFFCRCLSIQPTLEISESQMKIFNLP